MLINSLKPLEMVFVKLVLFTVRQRCLDRDPLNALFKLRQVAIRVQKCVCPAEQLEMCLILQEVKNILKI